MLAEWANGSHDLRYTIMKDDLSVAIAVHEAGHVVMGTLHNLHFRVNLPGLTKDVLERFTTTEDAATDPINPNLPDKVFADLCFGGYCAELCWYDDNKIKNGVPTYTRPSLSANDYIAYVNKFRFRISNPGEKIRQLSVGGDVAARQVMDLFKIFSRPTYDKLVTERAKLINTASQIYEFWSLKNFQRCSWTQPKQDSDSA